MSNVGTRAGRRRSTPVTSHLLTRAPSLLPRAERDGVPDAIEDDPLHVDIDQSQPTTTQTTTPQTTTPQTTLQTTTPQTTTPQTTTPQTTTQPTGTPTPACPTDIRLVDIIAPPLTASDVASGRRTGRGGVAKLEVSDPHGRNWNGTRIHENLTSKVNSCEPGRSACPNTSSRAGAAGSTFTVGRGWNVPGWSLPGETNRFYDFHNTELAQSFLHQHNLSTCERFCTQRYDCGGQTVGPEFEIHRLFTPDRIVGPSGPVDVTRVDLLEWENRPPPIGDFPERILPPGSEAV